MNRYLAATVCFLLAAAIPTLPGLFKEQPNGRALYWYERVFWYVFQDRPPNYEDCDEGWHTSISLGNIQHTFGHFNRLANRADREALRKVQDIDELWALFHKKYSGGQPLAPSPMDEDYISYKLDGWKRPFIFEIRSTGKSTIVRIISKGLNYQRWVEMTVDEQGGSTNRSSPFWGNKGIAK
jgi:hypothetical protein